MRDIFAELTSAILRGEQEGRLTPGEVREMPDIVAFIQLTEPMEEGKP